MSNPEPGISSKISLSTHLDEFYFQWHITDKCNMRCSHCYQANYDRKNEMSLQELKGVADEIFRTLNKWKKKGRIALTGGEPLTSPKLFPLIKYLEKSDEIEKESID